MPCSVGLLSRLRQSVPSRRHSGPSGDRGVRRVTGVCGRQRRQRRQRCHRHSARAVRGPAREATRSPVARNHTPGHPPAPCFLLSIPRPSHDSAKLQATATSRTVRELAARSTLATAAALAARRAPCAARRAPYIESATSAWPCPTARVASRPRSKPVCAATRCGACGLSTLPTARRRPRLPRLFLKGKTSRPSRSLAASLGQHFCSPVATMTRRRSF